MSNTKSSMVSCTILSPNNSGQRTYKVTRITPHCMVGQLSARRCGELFARSSYQASSNYGIGKDGEVALYVDESKRSWCSSSADNDNRAVTIECASGTVSPYTMNNKVWDSLVKLCTDICRRYGKTSLIWFGDKNTTLKYQPKDDEMVLTVHRWFAAKACPGDWLYRRMSRLAEEVTAALKAAGKAEPAEKVVEEPNTAAAVLIDNEEESREKQIWNFLMSKELNAYAVAGIMGNLYAESSLRPNNLQNSCERRLGMTDKGYTNAVNSGEYKNFANDGAGYGLAQWTWYTRKQALLDYAKSHGKSIDDMEMQLSFMWEEIQRYTDVMKVLRFAGSVKAASDAVLTGYEKPANQGAEVKKRRAQYGQVYYDRYAAAKEEEPAVKKLVYVVQCGAFKVQKNAEKRAEKLRKAGLEAEVVNSGGYWKVRLGEFASPAHAQPAVTKARKAKVEVIVTAVEM